MTSSKNKPSAAISEVADKMRRIHAVDHLNNFALMRTGGTLLHVAARQNQEDVARALLLDYGFNVNARDTWGRTPLLWALKRKQLSVTKFLLAAGADMFARDHRGQSALNALFETHGLLDFYELFLGELAKKCSSAEEMTRVLIEAGCDVYQASYSRRPEVIERMIESGSRIDAAHPEYRTTALHTAVVFEDIESMRVLLKHGFDATVVDAEGLNFLCYVYRYCLYHTKEKIASLEILLGLGIPSTSLTPDGEFQIWPSLVAGSAEAVRVILRSSSLDYNAKDSKGRTLLHYLAKNRNPRVHEEVKAHIPKLDANDVDESGSSPLHVAVAYSNPEMVEFLLDHGARVNCVEYGERCTPLYYALTESIPGSESHDDRCVQLLLQRGADPQMNAVERLHGQTITIFDIAVRHGTYHRIKFAVAHLAILEGLGTATSEIVRSRIASRRLFSEYFDRCRWLLRQNVSDSSTTLLKLLTANKHKMAKYLGNGHLVMKLKRISYKRKLRAAFPYYWSALSKRFTQGMKRRILKDKVAPVISRIFGGCLDKTDLIVDKTIEHLNDHDLQLLCQQREEIV